MSRITATEIKLRMEQWNQHCNRANNKTNMFMRRASGKMALRVMTNFGPVLGLVEQNIIVNNKLSGVAVTTHITDEEVK